MDKRLNWMRWELAEHGVSSSKNNMCEGSAVKPNTVYSN